MVGGNKKNSKRLWVIVAAIWLVALVVFFALPIGYMCGSPARDDYNPRDFLSAVAPEWTPDGSMIVFGHGGDIYAVNKDGSSVRRIHGSDSEDDVNYLPKMSPDGSRIAYAKYDGAIGWQIMTSGIDGTDERELTANVSDPQFRFRYSSPRQGGHSWSPDGSDIAFFNKHHIYVVGSDGGNLRRLAERDFSTLGSTLVWSPDGSRISYLTKKTGTRWDETIYVISSDGSGVTELVKGGEGDRLGAPTWSPDAQKIAFEKWSAVPNADSSTGGQYLYSAHTVSLDGSNLATLYQRFGDRPRWYGYASWHKHVGITKIPWSPDGTKLLISEPNSVSVVNADGSGLTTLASLRATNPPRPPLKASWSPDGSKIAVYNEGGYEGALFTMSSDGSDKRVLALNGNPLRPAQNQAWDPAYDAPTPTPPAR